MRSLGPITASCRTFFILRRGWNRVVLFSGADRGDRLQRHTPAPVTRYWRSWSSASTAAELMCPAAAGSIVTRRSTTATCRTIPCVQTTVNISPPYILVPGHCRWPVPRDPDPQYQYKVIFLQLIILFTNNKESSNKRPLFLAVCLLAQFVV